jgi:hypothetical protein
LASCAPTFNASPNRTGSLTYLLSSNTSLPPYFLSFFFAHLLRNGGDEEKGGVMCCSEVWTTVPGEWAWCTHIQAQAQAHSHINIYGAHTYKHKHKHTHTFTHAYTHIHIHTHACIHAGFVTHVRHKHKYTNKTYMPTQVEGEHHGREVQGVPHTVEVNPTQTV